MNNQIKVNRPVLYLFFKRLFGIILSFLFLLILSPVFIIVSILIKADSKGPVFFKQIRCGKDNKEFVMYKFRSMYIDAEERLSELAKFNEVDGPAFKITNDPRITKIGAFIRRTSIDELPQLLNILKGDMAFIGPRPPLPREVSQYTEYQMQRLLVKPGLSCYWQISGRSNLSFEEWVELDLKYIQERNLWVDFKIMLKTIPAVLKGDGAY